GRQRERGEQRDEDNRELPQPALDAAAAAVDRAVTTEGATQARAPGLQQDREGERGGDDELAGGQGGIHGWRSSVGAATDGSTGSPPSSERPVIPGHRGCPASARIVGATSARTPSWRVAPASAGPIATIGTGLSECAVTGLPAASRSSSA